MFPRGCRKPNYKELLVGAHATPAVVAPARAPDRTPVGTPMNAPVLKAHSCGSFCEYSR